MAQDYSAEWKKIEKLNQEGKFRSALEEAEKLYTEAERQGDVDEQLKALFYRAAYTGELEEDGQEAVIAFLSKTLGEQTNPTFLAVNHFVLARAYFDYLQQVLYRDRGTEEAAESTDPTQPLAEWSLRRLINTGTEHLLQSLELSEKANVRLNRIPAIVEAGERLEFQKPTLYDLLVYDALDLLNRYSGYLIEPSYAFRPTAEELLAKAGDFKVAKFNSQDSSLLYRSVLIYQNLLRKYQNDPTQKDTYVYADFQRLSWAYNQRNDEQLFYTRLMELHSANQGTQGAGDVLYRVAQLMQQHQTLGYTGNPEDNKINVRVLKVLTDIQRLYPNSAAAQNATNLENNLKEPSLSLKSENLNLPDQHILLNVRYRNLEQLHYRLVATEFSVAPQQDEFGKHLKELLKLKPLQSSRVRLAANDDYADHTTEIALEPLKPGQYELIVAGNDKFDASLSPVQVVNVVVSSLGILRLTDEKSQRLLVINRETGLAVAGVKGTFYRWTGNYRDRKLEKISTETASQEGYLSPPSESYGIQLLLEKDNDRVVVPISTYFNENQRNDYNSDRILTDRGLYRPGQTVYFKGIMLHFDEKGIPTIRTNQKTTVSLYDANYQVVKQLELTSDAYGAYQGSFELPTGGLNGSFQIQTDEGSTSIQVEAYKRPRFEVKFPDTPGNILAGESVTVTGMALGYAGPPVAGATVSYNVVRQAQSLPWYFYRWPNKPNEEGETVIATGTTTTDDDGKFNIDFTAELPENTSTKQRFRPGYQFVISVDVADQTGETHAASTTRLVKQDGVTLGFQAPEMIDLGTAKNFPLHLKYSGGQTPTPKEVQLTILPVTNPDPGLISRMWGAPDRPTLSKTEFKKKFPLFAYANAQPIGEWPTAGAQVFTQSITVAADSTLSIATEKLTAGHYRVEMKYSIDGKEETAYQQVTVLDSEAGKLPTDLLYHYTAPTQSSYPAGSVYQRTLLTNASLPMVMNSFASRTTKLFYNRNKVTDRQVFTHPVQLDDRGGMTTFMGFARHNRFFVERDNVNVPWPEQELQFSYETFRDKLRPGEEESWKIRITDHAGKPVGSQLLASMYDASLDQILGFNWRTSFAPFPNSYYSNSQVEGYLYGSQYGNGAYDPQRDDIKYVNFATPSLNLGPLFSRYGRRMMARESYSMATEAMDGASMKSSAPPVPYSVAVPNSAILLANDAMEDGNMETDSNGPPAAPSEVEAPLSIRKNLQETAFWYPELLTDQDGNVVLSFTAPEALTRWKLQLLAHTPNLEYAYSEKEVVTQKELMILPNAPRFLREGDRIEFTAKVSNLSDKLMAATTYLELFDPETEAKIENFKVAALSEQSKVLGSELGITLADGESKTVAWSITVPENSAGLIGYRVVVKAGNLSDGEQNVLPVLTNRIFLTAGKPFYIKPGKKATVTLSALQEAANSGNLRHEGFSFELTSDPSWLVVKSLPYLMEYPYDCTEQLANRFFANQLSYTIVNSNPALRNVFELWKKDPNALTSPLALNQDLKQAALEETPWLREAADESEQRERLAVLFDLNQLATEQEAALNKLVQRQNGDGSFSWFPGGPENRYMTQYVAETMIRLEQLGALKGELRTRVMNMTTKTFDFLDFKAEEEYERLQKTLNKKELEQYHPSSIILHYLYVRSTRLQGVQQVEGKAKQAYDFFLAQAEKFWLDTDLYEQAMLAVVFHNAGLGTSKTIMASLRERAIRKDEFGMYWKYPRGFSWQTLPIETHCRIIEAFQVNNASKDELDDMRLYLLQNKRTNRWETTMATAAAAYAFLQTDGKKLAISGGQQVHVSFPDLNKAAYQPQLEKAESGAEAGTGYYRVQWPGNAVNKDYATVQLKNKGERIAWGAMYWQYTQDIDAVVANNDNPLQLQRKLYRRINTNAGQKLEEITGNNPMHPGERLVVKLIITSDRDLEYVHLKDRRAASLEPTEQLSTYRYEGGIGFYFSPDDLAVHYFIDYLPRGTYTVEYDLFVNHAGEFSNGLSVIQSMYAPEFSAYSAGSSLRVE